MKHIYRNRKGRYVTQKTHERTVLRRAGIFAGCLLLATVFGIASHMTQRVDASNTMSDEQLCSLHAIVCEGEATTTIQVYEVGDVPEHVTAGEVALWYIESITELLDAGINQGDVDVLEDILEEQQMYARAVMINEATK